MYLPAITIGYAIPNKNFDATVHSVFRSALNLRLNKKNKLLTLLVSSEADLPQGIRLDTPDEFSFEKFCVGEQVTCEDKNLRLNSLTIDLHNARRWQCDLSALDVDTTTPSFSSAWNFVWDALNKRQKLSNAEIIAEELFRLDESARANVSRKVGEAMRDLVHATRRCELSDTSAIKQLIGLGSGLTPTGDDLLVGYLAGLWCTVQNKIERTQFIACLGKRIIRFSRETNDISRTYLYHAAQGQVSSRLANLAEAICSGENREHLLETAEAAMSVGHTSGMDAVTGLLVGLTVWINPNNPI
jgi:hypothetical protein